MDLHAGGGGPVPASDPMPDRGHRLGLAGRHAVLQPPDGASVLSELVEMASPAGPVRSSLVDLHGPQAGHARRLVRRPDRTVRARLPRADATGPLRFHDHRFRRPGPVGDAPLGDGSPCPGRGAWPARRPGLAPDQHGVVVPLGPSAFSLWAATGCSSAMRPFPLRGERLRTWGGRWP